jgi:tetratricopeptide (TPR) repeat protein
MWPWFSLNWWPGYYDYGYGLSYGGDTYANYVCNLSSYGDAAGANFAVPDVAVADAGATSPATAEAAGSNPFYEQALAAFRQGSYRDATRLALHAAVDEPKNPNVHVLLVLGMFASGEYRGAAIEAHTVALLGKAPDWPALYAFYGDAATYTQQLRALEKYAGDKPKSPEGRFLLGFQYMMAGHREAAQRELLEALKLTPRDRLTAQLLVSQGGTVPEDIARQLADWPPALGKPGVQETPKPPAPHPPATEPAP